jgi:hypothetical protein
MGAAVLGSGDALGRWWNGRDAAKRHPADWPPSEVLPEETWLLLLMKVVGAVVMYVGPVIVAAGPSTGPAAAAVDTGAAMAIALRAAATRTRRARVGFLANLALALRCVELPGKYSNILNPDRCLGMDRYDPFTAVDGSASGGPQGLAV